MIPVLTTLTGAFVGFLLTDWLRWLQGHPPAPFGLLALDLALGLLLGLTIAWASK